MTIELLAALAEILWLFWLVVVLVAVLVIAYRLARIQKLLTPPEPRAEPKRRPPITPSRPVERDGRKFLVPKEWSDEEVDEYLKARA